MEKQIKLKDKIGVLIKVSAKVSYTSKGNNLTKKISEEQVRALPKGNWLEKERKIIGQTEIAMEMVEAKLLYLVPTVESYVLEGVEVEARTANKRNPAKNVNPIWVLDLETNEVKKFDSTRKCSQYFGLKRANYINTLLREGRTYKGRYKFSRDGESFGKKIKTESPRSGRKTPVVVRKLNNDKEPTGKPSFFESITEAADYLKISLTALTSRLRCGKNNIFNGYVVWFKESYDRGNRDVVTIDRYRRFFSIGVEQVDRDGNVEKIFNSMGSTAHFLGMSDEAFDKKILDKDVSVDGFFYRRIGDSCFIDLKKEREKMTDKKETA